MRIAYSKMHGLNNTFMVVNAFARSFAADAELVRRWADPHGGVGFDQLLVVEPCDDRADFAFRVFNADGSEVRQCGNGARCVARFAHREGLVNGTVMRAAIGGSLMEITLLEDGQVCVDMGVPSFVPAAVPFVCDARASRYRLTASDQTLDVGVVSVGNPHAVAQVDDPENYPVARVGRALQASPQFPHSVNAGFMHIDDRGRLRLRVFERGVGETAACGSGACAAVAVGRRWGLLDSSVRVTQRGGDLHIEWDGGDGGIKMTGAAEYIGDGEIESG